MFPEYDVMLLQYKVLFYPGPWEPSGFMATQLFMETEPNCGYQWRMWHWTCNILWLEYNTIVSIFGPPNHQASFRSRVQAPTHLQLAAICTIACFHLCTCIHIYQCLGWTAFQCEASHDNLQSFA